MAIHEKTKTQKDKNTKKDEKTKKEKGLKDKKIKKTKKMKRQKGKKTKNAKRQRTKSEGYIVTVLHSYDVFVFMYSFCIFVSFLNFYKVHIP